MSHLNYWCIWINWSNRVVIIIWHFCWGRLQNSTQIFSYALLFEAVVIPSCRTFHSHCSSTFVPHCSLHLKFPINLVLVASNCFPQINSPELHSASQLAYSFLFTLGQIPDLVSSLQTALYTVSPRALYGSTYQIYIKVRGLIVLMIVPPGRLFP